jgi:hypothetical protein
MTFSDFLVSVLVVVVIGLIIYLKISKKTFKDLMIESKDLIKSMRKK